MFRVSLWSCALMLLPWDPSLCIQDAAHDLFSFSTLTLETVKHCQLFAHYKLQRLYSRPCETVNAAFELRNLETVTVKSHIMGVAVNDAFNKE